MTYRWTEATRAYWGKQEITALPSPAKHPENYEHVPMKRAIAYALDFVLLAFVSSIIAVFIFVVTLSLGLVLIPGLITVIWFAYHTVTVGSESSATLGMRMMGIQIRDFRGMRMSYGGAFVHALLFYVTAATGILLLANAFCMLLSGYGRGLHDLVLGTTAINILD